ncbi:hypothetical protein TNCT_222761 [Trichonephila clavata]|uniref:Uncharacterized protein n=1 Tax=Trichonephila clavata TaxID=2740835 RepID=A0A8X6EXG2_TRICU|nr:hypothetical protein TNCT_222761 [Trichonephila clavata]
MISIPSHSRVSLFHRTETGSSPLSTFRCIPSFVPDIPNKCKKTKRISKTKRLLWRSNQLSHANAYMTTPASRLFHSFFFFYQQKRSSPLSTFRCIPPSFVPRHFLTNANKEQKQNKQKRSVCSEAGIEPRAFHMQSERSTTELHPASAGDFNSITSRVFSISSQNRL